MALADSYSQLQTDVANWLDRSDLTSRIPDFITLAETRIGRRLRVRGVEARDTSITTASGTEYYTLPTDFLSARNVQLNTNPVRRLKYFTPEQLDYEYPSTSVGATKAFTIIGEQIQLKPVPNSANTLEIAYFKKLAALSDSNTTNWLTSNAPDLLLYGALIEAEAYLVDDPRIGIWKSAFDEAMKEFNDRDDMGRHSGSVPTMNNDTGNP